MIIEWDKVKFRIGEKVYVVVGNNSVYLCTINGADFWDSKIRYCLNERCGHYHEDKLFYTRLECINSIEEKYKQTISDLRREGEE